MQNRITKILHNQVLFHPDLTNLENVGPDPQT